VEFRDDKSPNDPYSNLTDNPFAAPLATDSDSHLLREYSDELLINPWVSMLTEPVITIRRIVNYNPNYHVLLLAAMYGIVIVLSLNDGTVESMQLSLVYLLPLAVVVGPIVGVLLYYVTSACLKWASSLLGGVATHAEMRAANVWSTLPLLIAAPVVIVTSIATSEECIGAAEPYVDALVDLTRLADRITNIWSFVLSLAAIAEVSHFSRWRAFGAIVLIGIALGSLVYAGIIASERLVEIG